MSGRSVAEIIGVRKVRSINLTPGAVVEDFDGGRRVVVSREESAHGAPGWRTTSGWFSDEWFDRGHLRHIVPAPTVDDLLAWFVSCGYLPNIDPVGDYDDEVLWSVSLIFAGEHVETEEPTLLAALESAVRAVAGED